MIANWIRGDLFSLLNQAGIGIDQMKFSPEWFAELLIMVWKDAINQTSAKVVLTEMLIRGLPPNEIVAERTLMQISNEPFIEKVVRSDSP